jgi:hypothetical protein
MPKDDLGTVSMMSTLLSKNQISFETFLDIFQKLFGLAADTPDDELKRIARDMIMMQGDIAKMLASYFGADYIQMLTGSKGGITKEEMAAAIMAKLQSEMQPPPPPQQPGLPPGGPPGAQPPGPMNGLPPGAAPMTPEMLMGAGNMQGAQNMLGNPMPGPGGMPMPGMGGQ